MNPTYKNHQRTNLLISLLCLAVIIFSAYIVTSSINKTRGTGILEVNSPGAEITLTRPNYQSVNIGTSSIKVKLKPGTYELIATKNRSQATATVTISKGKTTSEILNVNTQQASSSPYQEANNLIKKLPIIGPDSEYQISYKYTFSSSSAIPTIIITAPSSQNEQLALGWIQSQGFNLSDLNITYVNQNITNNNYTNGLP